MPCCGGTSLHVYKNVRSHCGGRTDGRHTPGDNGLMAVGRTSQQHLGHDTLHYIAAVTGVMAVTLLSVTDMPCVTAVTRLAVTDVPGVTAVTWVQPSQL